MVPPGKIKNLEFNKHLQMYHIYLLSDVLVEPEFVTFEFRICRFTTRLILTLITNLLQGIVIL